MEQQLSSPLGIIGYCKQVIRLTFNSIRPTWLWNLCLVLTWFVCIHGMALIVLYAIGAHPANTLDQETLDALAKISIMSRWLIGLLLVMLFFLLFIFQAIIFQKMIGLLEHRDILVQPRFAKLFIAGGRMFVATLVFIIVMVLLLMIPKVGGWLALATFLYLLPVLYLWYPLMVVIDQGVFKSLISAFKLVKGHWACSFILLLLGMLVIFATLFIFAVLGAVLITLFHETAGMGMFLILLAIALVFIFLIALFKSSLSLVLLQALKITQAKSL